MNQIDMTGYRYSDALMPVRYTICGVELKPFSLGHLMILENLRSPIVSPQKEEVDIKEGIYTFLQALLICGASFEDNLRILNDDEEHKKVMGTFVDNMLKNMDSDPEWNIFAKVSMFKDYMDYYMDIPMFIEQHSNNQIPSGTDWKQNIFLCFKKLGYADSDILNMNFKKLFYEWCSYAESEGSVKVMNKFELEQLKLFKKNKDAKDNFLGE